MHYQRAQSEVFGVTVYVSSKLWPKFSDLEASLMHQGISSREYAFTVTRILKRWAIGRELPHIPSHIFLSPWAMKRFMKVHGSQSVEIIDTNDVELLQSELTVARQYIAMLGRVRMSDLVMSIEPLLSPSWLRMYRDKLPERQLLITRAIDVLSEELSLRSAHDYNDFIGVLK
jgi:hypothetical protein